MDKDARLYTRINQSKKDQIKNLGYKEAEFVRLAVDRLLENSNEQISEKQNTIEKNDEQIKLLSNVLSDIEKRIVGQITDLQEENQKLTEEIHELQENTNCSNTDDKIIQEAIGNVKRIIDRTGTITKEQIRFNANKAGIRVDMFEEILKEKDIIY